MEIYCKELEHQNKKIISVCTYEYCQKSYRWICEECQMEKIHNHSQIDSNYIIDYDNFIKQLSKCHIPSIQNIMQLIHYIKNNIENLSQIVDQLISITEIQQIFETYKQLENNIQSLHATQQNNLVKILQINKDYQQILFKFKQISKQMQNIDQLDNQFQQLPMMFHQHIDVSRAPILSPNEQFFAYISKDLRINSINTRKKKFSFKPNDHINLVRYSQNSKYLFFCNYNYLNCLSSNNMKLIYSLKTKNVITDLHQIDNQLLICCKDIIIYDIFNKKNLIKIQLYRISSLIEFDKINNLILAVSAQQTIQFYERNCGKLVMSCETQKNDINFVQLINQSESLLGNNQQNLFLWQIDYSDQKLFLIRYFNSEWDQIKFFKSVDYDQKLIIRTQDNLYITDNQFLITYKLSIQSLYLDERDRFYQPQSMKYILLTDDTNYMILKQRSEVDE